MKIIRRTQYLDDGCSIESEIERRGNEVRFRWRLVDALGFVVEPFRRTETIPSEFGDDPAVQQAMFDPVEELWRHRVCALSGIPAIRHE